jgi:hypothetical protein
MEAAVFAVFMTASAAVGTVWLEEDELLRNNAWVVRGGDDVDDVPRRSTLEDLCLCFVTLLVVAVVARTHKDLRFGVVIGSRGDAEAEEAVVRVVVHLS